VKTINSGPGEQQISEFFQGMREYKRVSNGNLGHNQRNRKGTKNLRKYKRLPF